MALLMAEQVGYTNPYRLQHLLGRAIWDEEQVCAEVRDYVVEQLDDGAGILAVDETSFLKRGEESVIQVLSASIKFSLQWKLSSPSTGLNMGCLASASLARWQNLQNQL
ncbi:MAG: transposase [Chroococcidiopsidaceae cyanobacterium CP_BM_RX_35]|nr:transposase [Chroococcidiopsidaceae cyanobacterium CP_BM_RX_35]